MKKTTPRSDRWARIHAVVRRIPRGRVASYGQVAAAAGLAGHARQVGYALHALPEGSPVPWHRVMNARGVISLPPGSSSAITQRLRLEAEGVRFDAGGRVDLKRFGWRPGARAPRDAATRASASRLAPKPPRASAVRSAASRASRAGAAPPRAARPRVSARRAAR